MYKRLPALTTLLLLTQLNCIAAAPAVIEKLDCLALNDQLIQPNLAVKQLHEHSLEWTSLAEKCPTEPHILHNLGVVKAKLEQWEEAAVYFKKSLASEARSNQTYQHLNSIYRRQAVAAYRKALTSNTSEPNTPSLHYQLSTLNNAGKTTSNFKATTADEPSPALQKLVKEWAQEHDISAGAADKASELKFLLITDSQQPFAVIHTEQSSYILEFRKTNGQWQLLQERSLP